MRKNKKMSDQLNEVLHALELSGKAIANLEDKLEKLQEICASAYQMAGSAGAPVRFLDALANPLDATQDQIDALLPVAMEEFSPL